jgi:hypothetical protein
MRGILPLGEFGTGRGKREIRGESRNQLLLAHGHLLNVCKRFDVNAEVCESRSLRAFWNDSRDCFLSGPLSAREYQ